MRLYLSCSDLDNHLGISSIQGWECSEIEECATNMSFKEKKEENLGKGSGLMKKSPTLESIIPSRKVRLLWKKMFKHYYWSLMLPLFYILQYSNSYTVGPSGWFKILHGVTYWPLQWVTNIYPKFPGIPPLRLSNSNIIIMEVSLVSYSFMHLLFTWNYKIWSAGFNLSKLTKKRYDLVWCYNNHKYRWLDKYRLVLLYEK